MWLDAAVLLWVAFLAGFGARSGAAVAGIRLVSLPVAYAGALGAAWAFGPALAGELGWPELAGAAVAGTVGFVAVQLLLALLTRAARRAETPPPASRALGALFGGLRGALLALPLLWLAGLAEGARSSGVHPELPDLSGAQLPALGGSVIGAGVRPLLDGDSAGGRFALGVASHPAETVASLQKVVQDPRVVELQRDGAFWGAVERSAVSAALARPSVRALIADKAFRARLAQLGAVSPEAGRDAARFQTELAIALAELGPRLQALRDDPAFQALLADSAVLERVRSGDTLVLLGDPRVRDLMTRATR